MYDATNAKQIGTVQTWVGTGTGEPPVHMSTATLPNGQYRLPGNADLNWGVQVALFEREGKMLKQVKCGLCAEELIAPAWSVYTNTNAQAVRNFWHCTNCGYVFESLNRKAPVQIECVQEFPKAA